MYALQLQRHMMHPQMLRGPNFLETHLQKFDRIEQKTKENLYKLLTKQIDLTHSQ